MKPITSCILLLTVIIIPINIECFAAQPYTLESSYRSALQKTETVKIQDVRLDQSQEKINQANSFLYPHVSLVSFYLRQDSSGTGSSDPNQYSAKLTATQPLFHGLREFAVRRSTDADFNAQKSNISQTKLSLYNSVSQSFYNVLFIEQDLVNLNFLLDLTRKRITELQARTKIGRSRKGDLLSAQAQESSLIAQIESAKIQYEQAKDQFILLTGINEDFSLTDTNQKLPDNLPSINEYLRSIEERPDISTSQLQVVSAEENITALKADYYPGIDLTGNYYLKRTSSTDNKWDMGVYLTFPIFEGWITKSQVSESTFKVREKELLLDQARKSASKEIKSAYKTLQGSIVQLKSLEETVRLSEENYKEQMRDYRYGLATNLDVLQSLNSFYESKRDLDKTTFQAKMSYINLITSTGRLP